MPEQGYWKSVQGICKIVEFIGSFIAILCVSFIIYGSLIAYFVVCTIVSMIISALLFIAYITGIANKQWTRFELFFHFILGILYCIAAAVLIFDGYSYVRIIIAGIFGIIAVIAHFVDGYQSYKKEPLC